MKVKSLLPILLGISTTVCALEFPIALTNKTFNFPESKIDIQMDIPKNLHETYIKTENLDSYSYSGEENRFRVNLEVIKPSKTNYQSLVNGKFEELILKPFSDKENKLYGEYEIIKDESKGKEKTFEYEGYLKSQGDATLPAMQNLMHESYMLRSGNIIRVSCTVQGLTEEINLTKDIYSRISMSCNDIIKSVKVIKK